MELFTAHLPAGHFRPEAYIAPDLPPRAATATPEPGSAREVDRDRRPSQPAYGETTAELSFSDLLDVINPLHHIPVVGDIYRALTGDRIAAPARVAGGAIFGGPLGFISGIVNAIAADATGQNLGETMVAAVFGIGKAGSDPSQTAALAAVPAEVHQTITAVPVVLGAGKLQQPLTGTAALQALGADLRMAERRTAPPPRAVFTNRMLEGLKRYEALVTEKNAPPAPPAAPAATNL